MRIIKNSWTKRTAILSLFAAVSLVLAALPASASDVAWGAAEQDLDTTVFIVANPGGTGGNGNATVLFECVWALPDMDTTAADNPATVPVSPTAYSAISNTQASAEQKQAYMSAYGFTYAKPSGLLGVSDDAVTGPGFPCSDVPPGYEGTTPTVITVTANDEDYPFERRVQLWAVLDAPTGIESVNDVWSHVIHPDGTLKAQVHYSRVPNDDSDVLYPTALDAQRDSGTTRPILTCEGLGSSWDPVLGNQIDKGDPDSMWWGAYNTQQVEEASIEDDIDGLISKCIQREKFIYFAEFILSKHQPCGLYLVETNVFENGESDPNAGQQLKYKIDVQCTISLDLDFGSVDFGDVIRGGTKWIQGDTVMDGSLLDGSAQSQVAAQAADSTNSVNPTVKSIGSGGVNLKIGFSPMTATGTTKTIIEFDAKFGRFASSQSLKTLPQIWAIGTLQNNADKTAMKADANGLYPFGYGDFQTLCANETGKLDLSIHPDAGTPAGLQYNGTMFLVAVADGGTDNRFHEQDTEELRSDRTCNNDRGVFYVTNGNPNPQTEGGVDQRSANIEGPPVP